VKTFDGAGIYFNGGDCTYSLIEPLDVNNISYSNADIHINVGINPDVSDIRYDSQYLLQPRIIIINFKQQTVKLTAAKSGLCSDLFIEINGNNAKNL
jgi:hypothetical protein